MEFVNPDGKIIIIDNIYKFCQELGLDRKGFYGLIDGKFLSYKGWTLPKYQNKEELKKEKLRRYGKFYELRDDKGNIIQVKNLSEFSRQKGLNLNNMHLLVKGLTPVYGGYSLPETDLSDYVKPTKYTYIALINTEGEVISDKNPSALAKKSKIMSKESIYSLINGECNECKGWKIHKVEKEK